MSRVSIIAFLILLSLFTQDLNLYAQSETDKQFGAELIYLPISSPYARTLKLSGIYNRWQLSVGVNSFFSHNIDFIGPTADLRYNFFDRKSQYYVSAGFAYWEWLVSSGIGPYPVEDNHDKYLYLEQHNYTPRLLVGASWPIIRFVHVNLGLGLAYVHSTSTKSDIDAWSYPIRYYSRLNPAIEFGVSYRVTNRNLSQPRKLKELAIGLGTQINTFLAKSVSLSLRFGRVQLEGGPDYYGMKYDNTAGYHLALKTLLTKPSKSLRWYVGAQFNKWTTSESYKELNSQLFNPEIFTNEERTHYLPSLLGGAEWEILNNLHLDVRVGLSRQSTQLQQTRKFWDMSPITTWNESWFHRWLLYGQVGVKYYLVRS